MLLALLLVATLAHAVEIKNIPQIGPHYRVLTLDKNENPQNLLAVYTKLNRDCTVENTGHSPELGYYWLMDGEHYKRVHPLILKGIRNRLDLEPEKDPHGFAILFTDLKELDTDIANHPIEVRARKEGVGCTLEARLRLGASDNGELIRLTNIHSESKRTLWPPFRKVVSVTLSGVDVSTGAPVKRTYSTRQ